MIRSRTGSSRPSRRPASRSTSSKYARSSTIPCLTISESPERNSRSGSVRTTAGSTTTRRARPAAALRGAVGSEANGRTGCRRDREASGRGAQEFQRAKRPRRAGCSHAYGRRSCCSWRRRAARFRSRCSSTAAWRPATRWPRKWRHGAAEAGVESAGAESAGTGNQATAQRRRPVKGPLRSPRPSLVLRLRVAQPVPVRPLRARKPRARYPYGIRLRLHRPSSRSSLDWGLGRRPSRWRATRPLHPYSRHRRHRPQPLSRRANSPQRPSR